VTVSGGWLSQSLVACLLILGCSGHPTPTPGYSSAMPSASGITVVDARLMPPILEIAAHPEWALGDVSSLNASRALPSPRDLCVEVVRPNNLPLYVTIGVQATPWIVEAIVVYDAAHGPEPQTTYDSGRVDNQPDLCRHVLLGSGVPFPNEPTSVEISGGISRPEHVRAIAEAIVAAPERFGIDRSSQPSLNLIPAFSADDRRACYEGVVYQGGPRAAVLISLVLDESAWRLQGVRIVQQALREGGDGSC